MTDISAAVEAILPSVRADLERLVRIPSVSADPDRSGDVRASADEVARLAREAGAAEADVVSVDDGAPAVIARWPAPDGQPTVLLYAHHDVQPTGPEGAWSSAPFEPTERAGRLYGRGAADDKAGVAAHLAALRAHDGHPPVGVVLFVEGEEEIGSPTFTSFLRTYRDRLAADVIVVADSMNWSIDTPALTVSLRGGVDCHVEVQVLEQAVHSGMFGGPVVDALTVLCRMLATLHDENGDVAVPGLVTDHAADVDYPADRFRAEAGLLDGVELTGTGSLPDRIWARPAVSVVGIDAPSVADAANVLVHRAGAKVSMRLAPNQDPRVALDALEQHLRDHADFGAHVTVTDGMAGGGVELETANAAFGAAEAAFGAAFGVPPVRIGVGGSIPFIAEFQEIFPDAAVLVTGVEDPASGAHGVDESLHLGQFAKVCRAEALLLQRLSDD
ncbi:acetylornithine deacetylase/succinyl-diaminopimelate desuccinylase-like protein [Haloactinopolyspora alba]|uniref:Acetylornithine deacetylase/succinyl-diaminopimelate desuccinylase-like protein n=1 Tax=Haloactinopolyspora alba TaxID=648780 RepID=A0A2P8EFL6_9ACTN|nr:dipeptidase [Haloactinopolyspora alba]PSL08265.1 acetylornithine deacetylase/succinyl-diaminopimelate desuccinylase-like protein [Haloactinopolyspora alba]